MTRSQEIAIEAIRRFEDVADLYETCLAAERGVIAILVDSSLSDREAREKALDVLDASGSGLRHLIRSHKAAER